MLALEAAPGADLLFSSAYVARVALILAVGCVYANGLSGPFLFDDFESIVDNPALRQAQTSWWPAGVTPDETTLAGRPVVALTFAINYALGGHDVRGYHLVNVAIHALCALALFGIVRRTLFAQEGLAFAVALLWAVHPLCTEAVDYVVQRTETLMALFYMLALYCAIRALDSTRRLLWYGAAIAACALGMGSKEVMLSCPLVILLYDRAYGARPLSRLWRERWPLYVGLCAGWTVLVALIGRGPRGESVGFDLGVSAWSYAKNQCVVVLDYLRHAVWPHPLVFDYGYPRELAFGTVARPAALLFLLIGAALLLALRRPAAGFPALAFFVILAPTSSVVPIVTEVGAERRVYLPLAALVALTVVAVHRSIERLGRERSARSRRLARVALLLLVATALGATTARRNSDYQSAETIWRSAVRASPQNARAHNGLGQVLYREGRLAEARQAYERALEIEPDFYHAQFNLGLLLADLGEAHAALERFACAARLQPSLAQPRDQMAEVHNDLGNALAEEGRRAEGVAHLRRALALRPDFALAHYNLARLLALEGDPDGAIAHNRAALALDPTQALAHSNLGTLLQSQGRLDEAITSYRRALEIDPRTVEARNNLGLALAAQGRPEEARREFREALRIAPDFALARENLAELEAALAARP